MIDAGKQLVASYGQRSQAKIKMEQAFELVMLQADEAEMVIQQQADRSDVGHFSA